MPTVNNKLGLGEKKRCKTMLMEIYGIQEFFFKEIDASIKRNCRNVNDIRNYLFMFQGFSQDLMMLMGTLMKWKFRIPGLFKRALRTFTEKRFQMSLFVKTGKTKAFGKRVSRYGNIRHHWDFRKLGL